MTSCLQLLREPARSLASPLIRRQALGPKITMHLVDRIFLALAIRGQLDECRSAASSSPDDRLLRDTIHGDDVVGVNCDIGKRGMDFFELVRIGEAGMAIENEEDGQLVCDRNGKNLVVG